MFLAHFKLLRNINSVGNADIYLLLVLLINCFPVMHRWLLGWLLEEATVKKRNQTPGSYMLTTCDGFMEVVFVMK